MPVLFLVSLQKLILKYVSKKGTWQEISPGNNRVIGMKQYHQLIAAGVFVMLCEISSM